MGNFFIKILWNNYEKSAKMMKKNLQGKSYIEELCVNCANKRRPLEKSYHLNGYKIYTNWVGEAVFFFSISANHKIRSY